MQEQQMSQERVIANIRDLVKPFLEAQDRWHGVQHVARVVAFAKEINAHEKADPFLVEAGAWLHQFHEPNLAKLEPVLDQLRIRPEQKDRLREIVEQCRPGNISVSSSHEARVVFDADAGDLMGPAGILREALCEYGDRGSSPAEAITAARNVQQLFVGKLQTEGGKKYYQPRIQDADLFWESLSRDEANLEALLQLAPELS